ncbi:signal peptidase I [Thermodesulfobacteriota bacterium]
MPFKQLSFHFLLFTFYFSLYMIRDMHYTGPSMNPTLKAGDALTIIPYGNKKIRMGDVIVFPHPTETHHVAHRVFSVDSKGIKTRGDNNPNIDPWVLSPDHIIGRVVCAKRMEKRVTIRGGINGRILARVFRTIKKIDLAASKILHPAYHWLARSGIFRKNARLLPQTRMLSFNRPEGIELQLLMGDRVIGRHQPGNRRWQIFRPFRLFVDEASLPTWNHPY